MFDLSQFNKYKEDIRREVKKAKSGVPDIYSVWENQGWVAPEVIDEYAPDRTILKLSFVHADVKKVTEKSDRKNR